MLVSVYIFLKSLYVILISMHMVFIANTARQFFLTKSYIIFKRQQGRFGISYFTLGTKIISGTNNAFIVRQYIDDNFLSR